MFFIRKNLKSIFELEEVAEGPIKEEVTQEPVKADKNTEDEVIINTNANVALMLAAIRQGS